MSSRDKGTRVDRHDILPRGFDVDAAVNAEWRCGCGLTYFAAVPGPVRSTVVSACVHCGDSALLIVPAEQNGEYREEELSEDERLYYDIEPRSFDVDAARGRPRSDRRTMSRRVVCAACYRRGYVEMDCESCGGWGVILALSVEEWCEREAQK